MRRLKKRWIDRIPIIHGGVGRWWLSQYNCVRRGKKDLKECEGTIVRLTMSNT